MEGKVIQYARRDAVQYARRWALSRNRAYNDFTKGGGDWVPSSIMRKFIYKSGRTQSAQGRETCP